MTFSIDDSTVLRAADTVLRRTAGGETVLLDLGSEEFYGLDGVGARVFELLEQPTSVDVVVETLLEEYDVSREVLSGDVQRLLREMAERGLVVPDQASG